MWRYFVTAIGSFLLFQLMAGPLAAANGEEPNRVRKHDVFAHYMVCFAAYGERVEDYKREIQVAQAVGIDGFALNCGAWHNEPHYPRRTQTIYRAAQELGTGFKLFFSVDFAGLNSTRRVTSSPTFSTWSRPMGIIPTSLWWTGGRSSRLSQGNRESRGRRTSSLRSRLPDMTSSWFLSFTLVRG